MPLGHELVDVVVVAVVYAVDVAQPSAVLCERAVTNLATPQRLPSLLVLCDVVADREVLIWLARLVQEGHDGGLDPVVTADT